MKRDWLAAALSAALVAACGGGHGDASSGPHRVELPFTDGLKPTGRPAPRRAAAAPPSTPPKETPPPPETRVTLTNGLAVVSVRAAALPLVHVRLVVRAGANDAAPGVGRLAAEMLLEGGTTKHRPTDLVARFEGLGADPLTVASHDAAVLGFTVTKDKLGEALELLAQMAREPAFDRTETLRRKALHRERIAAALRGSFVGDVVAQRALYPRGSPYATMAALPLEVAAIDVAQLRAFHRRFYMPKAATLVLAGDVDDATARDLAQKHFGSWSGGEPPKVEHAAPRLPETTRVLVIDRPKSAHSAVLVATLAPARQASDWAAIRVASQVFSPTGSARGRLFQAVEAVGGRAPSAAITEVAHGEQPFFARAEAPAPRTADAVAAILGTMDQMRTAPPTPAETAAVTRGAAGEYSRAIETAESIADLVAQREALGLGGDAAETYRQQRGVTAADVVKATAQLFPVRGRLVVVVGDAATVAPSLARFGEVTILDPRRDLEQPMKNASQGAK